MDADGEPMEIDDQQAEQAAIVENRNRINAFLANRHNVRTVTRNCKLKTVLNDDYQGLLVSTMLK